MKQSRNGYKLSKFPQKILADLFVYSIANFDRAFAVNEQKMMTVHTARSSLYRK